MAKRPKSEALASVHETMQDLHSVGAIDDKRMQHFDEKCLVDAGSASTLSFTVYKARGEWHWRLQTDGGRTIATSGEGYKSRKACMSSIALVKSASEAEVAA